MQPLESAEQFAGVSHIETDSIVPKVEVRFAVVLVLAELDPCLRLRASEFNCIVEQVRQRDFE